MAKVWFYRLFDNLSLEIRNKRMTRERAINIIKKNSKKIRPDKDKKFCKFSGIKLKEFDKITNKFRNKKIWKKIKINGIPKFYHG